MDSDGRFIVTGTGRSGTLYMVKLLNKVGVPATHEALYAWDANGWTGQLCDVSWTNAPHLADLPFPAVHIVRDPRKVIASLMQTPLLDTRRGYRSQGRLRFEMFPYIWDIPDVRERSFEMWRVWIEMCEAGCGMTQRIEDAGPAGAAWSSSGTRELTSRFNARFGACRRTPTTEVEYEHRWIGPTFPRTSASERASWDTTSLREQG